MAEDTLDRPNSAEARLGMPLNAGGGLAKFTAVAVNLAVISRQIGGDGWESNPPRTP